MKHIALVLALILACPQPAAAQEASSQAPEPPNVPEGSDTITAVTQGDRAAYTGMLLDTNTAIRWTFRLQWFRNELRLTLNTHAHQLASIQASHEAEMLRIRESYEREISGLRADLRTQAQTFVQSQSQPWFDTFSFGITVGIVAAALLVGLAAWVVTAI